MISVLFTISTPCIWNPWDGPAGIVMSDGRYAACGLDRNGLHPARYVITRDKLITLASEVGIYDYEPDEVVEKGRVGPGELLVLDTLTGRLWTSWDIDRDLKSRHPYRQWMQENSRRLAPFAEVTDRLKGKAEFDEPTLRIYQKMLGYSREEIDQVIRVLGEKGQEAVGSMGDDNPIAVLSEHPRLLYDYFRQKFAQVTNPPIDPLRESHVMSLATCIGREQNVFNETHSHAHRGLFDSPILIHSDFAQALELDDDHYKSTILSVQYSRNRELKDAIVALCREAVAAAQQGTVLIVLSDHDINEQKLPMPMAVGAVHRALITNNLRCDANILVETAGARDPHHFAVLLGFGATAIYPFLAYEILAGHKAVGVFTDEHRAINNYRLGINKGLLKIIHGGEYHAYNPDVVMLLQKAVKTGNYSDYQLYADCVNTRPISSLRDLLVLKSGSKPIALKEVEAAEDMFPRFDSAAMSIGALSPEAHEALAIGMNRLGGNSNSGEGGEDPARFNSERTSKIKQVASGRFGVTAHYLMNAEVIQK